MKNHELEYIRLTRGDKDIPFLTKIHFLPEISRFISLGPNYFNYVTSSENVFFYKVISKNKIVACTHIERDGPVLYMDIITLPEYQRQGIAQQMISDIKSGKIINGFERILVSIDRDNISSIRLFEKAGFTLSGEKDELLDYSLTMPNT